MNYSHFLAMHEECSLLLVALFVFVLDLFVSSNDVDKPKRPITLWCAIVAMLAQTIFVAINTPIEPLSSFSGMYTTYPITSALKIVLNCGLILTLLMAIKWLKTSTCRVKQGEFCTLLIFTLLGMYFMVSSGHLMVFFIGLELASIPMAALITFDKRRHQSAEAGVKYILMAMFSTALMLYGISLLYGSTGTLYFEHVHKYITGSYLQILALAFMIAGLGFKIALVPFHNWAPDVYQASPTPVTAYFSTVSKGAASFALFIIVWRIFYAMMEQWVDGAFWLILATITVGNLFALRQTNLKRLMAYSSISQAGYILLAIIGLNMLGVEALIYYCLVYVVANFAIFTLLHLAEEQAAATDLQHFDGFATRHPYLAIVMTLALFSLAGIPPFAGFFSKFFVFMAAFKAGHVLVVLIALLNTVVSLYYYLLIVKAIYINKSDANTFVLAIDWPTKAVLILTTIGVVGIGLYSPIYELIHALNITAFSTQ